MKKSKEKKEHPGCWVVASVLTFLTVGIWGLIIWLISLI